MSEETNKKFLKNKFFMQNKHRLKESNPELKIKENFVLTEFIKSTWHKIIMLKILFFDINFLKFSFKIKATTKKFDAIANSCGLGDETKNRITGEDTINKK
mgnify:CR=1 FL=1